MSEKVKVKLEDRCWAEPHTVSLYLRDEKGIFEVWRWYTAGDTLIECYENEQEFVCQGFIFEKEDALEALLRAVKCVLEGALQSEAAERTHAGVKVEIETNSERIKEKIAAIVSKLSI
ncbi:MAG: hypothetical protein QXS63_05555 [Zestosphaera sp.]